MKKIFILALMVMVGISLAFVNVKADEARTITRKTVVATAGNTVAVGHSATIYRIGGYASSANAVFGVVDNNTIVGNFLSSTNVKVEGGEATQYDSITPMDFGPDGLEFYTGVTVFASGCSVVIEYI